MQSLKFLFKVSEAQDDKAGGDCLVQTMMVYNPILILGIFTPYSMSQSKGKLLVHRLLTFCTISVMFSSLCLSRKLGRARNPAAIKTGFGTMTSSSEPVKLPPSFLASMAPSFDVTLDPSSRCPTLAPQAHDHLLAALRGDRSLSLLWVNTKGHDCWIAC